MPIWLSILLGVVGGIAAVATLIVTLAKPLLRIARILRAVDGEKNRPGLLQEVGSLSTAITKLSHAVTDLVAANKATDARLVALEQRFDAHVDGK